MAGKGSKPRPLSVDRKTFDANWDHIFNNKKKREQALEELTQLGEEMERYDMFKAQKVNSQSSPNKVLITSCPDKLRWYSSYVGHTWDVISDEGIEYKVRAADGYINFILKKDCEVL